MNSNLGKVSNPQRGSVSFNSYELDFGLGSGPSNNRPRSLNDQKLQQVNTSYSFPSTTTFSATQPKPASSSWSSNKPSWTHQPSPAPAARSSLDKPASMVGDILGRSWTSAAPSGPSTGLGITGKNPNLFGDLVGSALGKTSSSNVPLKNAAPFSTGSLADSLPKPSTSTATTPPTSTWGSGANFGSHPTYTNNINGNNRNLGGPSMKSGAGVSAILKKDPFGSLVDFGSKPVVNNANSVATNNSNAGDVYSFGAFQNASKSATSPFPTDAFPSNSNNSMGSASNSGPKVNNFGIPTQDFSSHKHFPSQSMGVDPLDTLFSPQSTSSSAAPTSSVGPAEVEDWGLGSELGGNNAGGTTDLEGLPSPPAGVSASAAKNKGLDNHKQGQFADAIKWLSWAILLLEKAGNTAATVEVPEHDSTNVSVLVQRALLYESTEKYELGAEDLRAVLKIDPTDRVARSTIHRLNQLSG